jgi:beta-galactosidase
VGREARAEVRLPNAVLAAEDKLSPHAHLDLARFNADVTARFLDRQAAIIKRHARAGQWVTTNYTNITTSTDPRRSRGMDFVTFTLYPVAGNNILGGDSYAIGDPTRLMEAAAYYRPITGTFGVMELQPGQVNWASVNPQPMPGAVGMWMWHAFGAGASLLSTYRFRHPLRGSEMYHEGIVGTDGVTLSKSGGEYVETMRAIQRVQSRLDSTAALPPRLTARRTGILWSHDNFWDLEIQPQTTEWKTWAHRNPYTMAVKSTGAPMDFIAEGDDFSRYPFIVAPAYQMVSDALVAKWRRYVEQGGHLVLKVAAGRRTRSATSPRRRGPRRSSTSSALTSRDSTCCRRASARGWREADGNTRGIAGATSWHIARGPKCSPPTPTDTTPGKRRRSRARSAVAASR